MIQEKETEIEKVEPQLRLDLGCGQNCNVGEDGIKFTGVDFVQCEGVDIIHDLTVFPYPFEDNSVSEIFSSHFVEHLDGMERMKFFNELYRILKPGGTAKLIHPYYKSVRAVQDPTHKWPPISEHSYFYWDKEWRKLNKLDHYPITCDFAFQVFYSFQDPTVANRSEETRNFWIDKYWNIVADLIVNLKKR